MPYQLLPNHFRLPPEPGVRLRPAQYTDEKHLESAVYLAHIGYGTMPVIKHV